MALQKKKKERASTATAITTKQTEKKKKRKTTESKTHCIKQIDMLCAIQSAATQKLLNRLSTLAKVSLTSVLTPPR
jgi:hypothetical protein